MRNFKGLAALVMVLGTAGLASAQAEHGGIPQVEVAVSYSYMRANASPGNCGCFNLNGGSAEVAVRTYRNLSAVFDMTGVYAGSTSIPGQSLGLLSFTGGPRFSYPLHHIGRMRIIPFTQGLVGVAHGFEGQFPTQAGFTASAVSDMAVLVGGGLDLQVSPRFALRVPQADYGLDLLPNNADNHENLLRVSAGVVLRLR